MEWCIISYILVVIVVANEAILTRQSTRIMRPSTELSKKKIPQPQWFLQPLDHFDITNPNTWSQRYYVIDEYYQKGGPVFLVVEGEWEASGGDILYYASAAFAKKHNGILFSLEHRYYGESRPTSDLSVENLRYLSADQALADAAYFIDGMTSQYQLPENTKWVAFGGSYAANLAAWLRYKYSHLVYASVAYSAPLLAKLNFHEYKSHVRDVLKGINKHCINAIEVAHKQVKATLEGSCDLSAFTRKFQLCDPLGRTNTNDVRLLFEILGDNVAALVQNNHAWSIQIETACDIMLNETIGDYIDRYAEMNNLLMRANGKECLECNYDKYVDQMKNVSWESEKANEGARQWTYQTCTEYGYYQTSQKPDHLFSDDIPLEFFFQQCVDIYGAKFNQELIDRGIQRTNIVYGGQDIKATKVAYVFGEQDPWLHLGVTETQTEAPAIVIEGESHCACLYCNSESDSEVYKSACNQIEGIVTQWCQE